MATGSIFRVTLVGSFRNQISQNVLHYVQTSALPSSAPDAAFMAALEGTISAIYPDPLKAVMSQESRYEGLITRWLAPSAADDLQVFTTADAGPGEADAPGTCPSQVCGLIRKKGAKANRHNRGRFYAPFPPAGAFDNDDLVAAAYYTLLNDLADALFAPIEFMFGGFNVVLQPCLINPARPFTPSQVVQWNAARGFATQRRRGYFGKPNINPLG